MNRAKKAAREKSVQETVNRNLRIKRLLHTSNYTVPPLYAVKVWVDDELREELRLSGREKRGRVFIEANTDGVTSFKGLKGEMFGFFRALKKNSFLLTASFPSVNPDDGSLSSEAPGGESWTIQTDDDVIKTFEAADKFFEESAVPLKRPSIQVSGSANEF